jgi:hypothetical protein
MRIFSIEEANALLPQVRPLLMSIKRLRRRLLARQESAKNAATGAELGGGGMIGGNQYVEILLKIASDTSELDTFGIQLKDFERGLIDFPSLRDGRVVLLCWHFGDGDQIEWWHDVEAGFAGRQPL